MSTRPPKRRVKQPADVLLAAVLGVGQIVRESDAKASHLGHEHVDDARVLRERQGDGPSARACRRFHVRRRSARAARAGRRRRSCASHRSAGSGRIRPALRMQRSGRSTPASGMWLSPTNPIRCRRLIRSTRLLAMRPGARRGRQASASALFHVVEVRSRPVGAAQMLGYTQYVRPATILHLADVHLGVGTGGAGLEESAFERADRLRVEVDVDACARRRRPVRPRAGLRRAARLDGQAARPGGPPGAAARRQPRPAERRLGAPSVPLVGPVRAGRDARRPRRLDRRGAWDRRGGVGPGDGRARAGLPAAGGCPREARGPVGRRRLPRPGARRRPSDPPCVTDHARVELAALDWDYVALGHHHGHKVVREAPCPAVYPGATARRRGDGEARAVLVDFRDGVGAMFEPVTLALT